MAAYSFKQVRTALKRMGYVIARSTKHETWQLLDEHGYVIRQVQLSHKSHGDVPMGTFRFILREQMGITEEEFRQVLSRKGKK